LYFRGIGTAITMDEKTLQAYLLTHYPRENASCEWKEFANLKNFVAGSEGGDIVSYVSGIANMEGGHLVIGVEDLTCRITGIAQVANHTPENLPQQIANKCPNVNTEGLYVEEFVTTDTQRRVWVIHIPKHLPRRPVVAHSRKWQRLGDSLVTLTKEREDSILAEPLPMPDDWSRGLCPNASFSDLDPVALAMARANYITKHTHLAADVASWDDVTFLNKARVTIEGIITRAALLLLGKPEAAHHLGISPRITWILKDERGEEQDYRHFAPPFLAAVNEIYALIRNLRIRYIKDETLFPEEMDKYDPFVVREALHNCLAHQQYAGSTGRVTVVEFPDRLVFTNAGPFLPGTVENVIQRDAPGPDGQNPFLAEAMVQLNMIDTIGSGIRRMFTKQRDKYLPLPDYELGGHQVKVVVTGKVLDLAYARVLSQHPDLTLEEIILLDKVQKHKALSAEEVAHLRRRQLVEGRRDGLYISSGVAAQTSQNVAYLKNRGLGDKHYQHLITELVNSSSRGVSRGEITELIWEQLPMSLTEEARQKKITQLLVTLRRQKLIQNVGGRAHPCWMPGSAATRPFVAESIPAKKTKGARLVTKEDQENPDQ
jgi:ATP-dependent DNA helicase RecG